LKFASDENPFEEQEEEEEGEDFIDTGGVRSNTVSSAVAIISTLTV
jgi:hypothetical protein